MQVFVECRLCGTKISLDETYETPAEYPSRIKLTCENGHTELYNRQDLEARTDGSATAAGAILGGAAGAAAGPIGVAIGTGIGSILGQNKDQEEEEKVRKFNNFYF